MNDKDINLRIPFVKLPNQLTIELNRLLNMLVLEDKKDNAQQERDAMKSIENALGRYVSYNEENYNFLKDFFFPDKNSIKEWVDNFIDKGEENDNSKTPLFLLNLKSVEKQDINESKSSGKSSKCANSSLKKAAWANLIFE